MAKLKDVATLVSNRITSKDLTPIGELLFAHPQHLLENNKVDWNKCLKIASNNSKIKAIIQTGDIIVVTRGGKCGRLFLHTEKTPFVTGQVCTIIKSQEANLFERIVKKKDSLNNLIQGSLIKNISLKSLSELDI